MTTKPPTPQEEIVYPHDFKMMKGSEEYSDSIVCTKCGYIVYQNNDGGTRYPNYYSKKKVSEHRRENVPKSCIC